MIFSIEASKIVVKSTGELGATWNDLKAAITALEVCYAVFDYSLNMPDGRLIQKLVLVSWVPDTTGVRKKMMYGSSLESFKSELSTPFKVLQASSAGELDEDQVKALILKV